MTAIYGLWRFDEGDTATNFRRMGPALSRFGSDAHDVWIAHSALMMGRYLHHSLAEDSFPDRRASDRRYVVAADVRLTDREDLARQLKLGSEAAEMSDSGLVEAAIDTWHEQAFDRIYGEFAVAAWDTREQRLLLARDHLGRKPLFYHRCERFFAFASMPAGLHALPEVPRGPDIDSMKRFLAVEVQRPGKTHFEAIARIMPAHHAIVTQQAISEKRYWNPDLTPLRLASHDDYAEALSSELSRAVAAALRGVEGQVGAHLSSGFDSTAVATTAAQQLAPSGTRVVAYTAAPREGYETILDGRTADESDLAGATAAMHPNMEHRIIRSNRSPLENLRRTASIYGFPILNMCNLTWYDAINDDAATRGITVMLDAAMGNATISEDGILALPELLRAGRTVAWAKVALALARNRSFRLSRILWNSFNHSIPKWLYRRLIDLIYGAHADWANSSALKAHHYREATVGAAREFPIPGAESRLLPNGWFRPAARSVDRRLELLQCDEGAFFKGIVGEWNIDYRDPTADRRLVEFSLRVPAEQLVHDGQNRALLRKVLADRAPAEVLNNRLHGYQAADWHEWLSSARQNASDEIERIKIYGPTAELMDTDRLDRLIRDWPDDDPAAWKGMGARADYRYCLLRAISAASFMRQASGSNY